MTKEELKEQDVRLNRICLHWTEWEKRAKELEKENAELKEKLVSAEKDRDYWKGSSFDWRANFFSKRSVKAAVKAQKRLRQAIDLIRNLLRVTYGEGWNYSLDWKVQAEKFLKEVEK